ncbi:unnamed protein product [Phyllotreta striolata]|uniref:Ig-like domain-containing protein n=1 Tax=Phyllotreta striolata TaxID=444603 RepID=A0A9N9XNQ8_PHYSR|nr:unnamed protein product [Phyllotreta striolata]
MHASLLFILWYYAQLADSTCPRLCECKWKSGKESVFCQNASLVVIPPSLDAGTQILDLTGNNLTAIKHEEFSKAGLINLQKIFLVRCRLKTLERYSFKHLINLVELDLSYNLLNNVPSHTFDSVTELRELKLNGNPIQKIFNEAFLHVPQLIRLEISECKLSYVEERAFSGLEKSLEWLKLDNNKLAEVQSKSFTPLQSLHGLELEGNPWNCSCSLRPLREWMVRKNVPFGVPPVCHSPKRLYMRPWDKLELDDYACVPEIFAFDGTAHGVEGKNVTMTCRIAGVPEPSVRWLMKNKVIANLTGASYPGGKKLYVVHFTNNSSELTIFSADLQDAGVYVCSAENKAGKAEASVTLAVSKKPAESALSDRVLLASVLIGVGFVVTSCFASLCVYSARRRRLVKWRSRECRREDNYEKIEMNHKGSNANGGVGVGLGNAGMGVGQELVGIGDRRNGEYRVVPDRDQDADEEEDNNLEGSASNSKVDSGFKEEFNGDRQSWNSSENMLDPDDLHIPRRTIQETRDNMKKSSSGYNQYATTSPAAAAAPCFPAGIAASVSTSTRRYFPPPASSMHATKELPRVAEDAEKRFPDLIEGSPNGRPFELKYYSASRAASDSGSATDINEIFCTLPRKKEIVHSSRYTSTESQMPLLLAESRYSSSGGESILSGQSRRMSDSPKYPLTTSLNRNRVNKISSSYLNLTREEGHQAKESMNNDMSATPLLDVSNLENRVWYSKRGASERISPTTSTTPNANSYDYHAAQLERFLEEYRNLQKQLTKMKETCDNLCQEKEKEKQLPFTPSTSVVFNKPSSLALSPNSNQPLEESLDFKHFENELKKYLLSKKLSPKNFNSGEFDS